MKNLEQYTKDILTHAHNPEAMAKMLLDEMMSTQDGGGYVISDPTDPVVLLAEMAVSLGHATIEANREAMTKFYPSMARNFEDLFAHMSDRDMMDVFAQPAPVMMSYLVDYAALVSKAEPLDSKGVRKLVIPRDTQVTVGGYTFTQQYPVEIRVLSYGSIKVVQDTTIKNPVTPLPEKFLVHEMATLPNTDVRLVSFKVPMLQYNIDTHHDSIVPGVGWKGKFKYRNHFFYARVWNMVNGAWVELPTKYSKVGFDRNTPTAIVQVDRGEVTVRIPEVYINEKKVRGDIRVDVYSTLGNIDAKLGGYNVDDFAINMRDFSNETPPAYYTPLKSLELFTAYSDAHVIGGREQLPFEKLRKRIVDNAIGPRSLPISDKQLVADSERFGFNITKALDYVTSRIYHATSSLPNSTIPEVSSVIGTLSSPLVVNRKTLEACDTVINNGQRYTLTPETIYTHNGNRFDIDVNMSNTHKLLRSRDLVALANQKNYYFSPFYYILDLNNDAVDVRPYYLGDPSITNRSFLNHNETTELDVYTQNYTIVKTPKGFKIRTLTKSEKPYQSLKDEQCFAQISFNLTADDRTTVYLNGKIVGKENGERIWEFDIETDTDIDRKDELIINNFFIADKVPTKAPMPLDVNLNLFYGTIDYYPKEYSRSTMDELIKAPTADAKGVTHETLKLLLGKPMQWLWASARPINGSINYQKYEEDVYKVWPVNVPKYEGKYPVYEIVEVNGVKDVQIVYEHRKGDFMLDDKGEKIIQHKKGTVVYENGKPVVANPREIVYQYNLAGFDAKYLFSNALETQSYLNTVVDSIVTTVTVTLDEVQKQLLDQTKIYYKVKSTIGNMEILRDDGSRDFIPSDLKFAFRVFLSATNRRNTELIEKINAGIRKTVSEYLNQNKIISRTDMVEAIKKQLDGVAITIEMEKMGPDEDVSVFTVVDDTAQANVAKRLEIAPDGTIVIKDNVVITPTRHELK